MDLYKAKLQDDRERDRMIQDMEIAMAQIAGKYGIAIDTASIKAQQAATAPMPAAQDQVQQMMPQPNMMGGM